MLSLSDEFAPGMKQSGLEDDAYRDYVDSFKVDTQHILAGIIQDLSLARREGRVLTVREINETWADLFRVSYAVESLMHYAEQLVAAPNSDNRQSLRRAFWRNRDSDDVDPHYEDRFW